MKKILFLSGTRADYGKLKALMKTVEQSDQFETYIYVSGMHLLEKYGNTYKEIEKDNYRNVYVAFGLQQTESMSFNLGNLICNFSGYVRNIQPDMIIVHGDRIDALAGAVVGALNNIIVAHIEGGELSGTIDESIRHTITKLAHLHLVCNLEAKKRLLQMGEEEERIYVLGSPDVDLMFSDHLPSLSEAKERYGIPYAQYGILMYHPVTTEYELLGENIQKVVNAVISSDRNYVVVYPNNDLGSELILNEYKRLKNPQISDRFCVFPSIRFECFLSLLKNADFIVGNSSAGVREACVYGIPTIDIGSRQQGRYSLETIGNIQHVEEQEKEILSAMENVQDYHKKSSYYGDGNSANRFMEILQGDIWNFPIQKHFVDIDF